MVTRRAASSELPPSLPPVESRKKDFIKPQQIIETPLTPTGLVDTKKLVKLVRGTLHTAHKWPSVADDEHHLLWPNKWYPDMPEASVNPHVFRNEPYNKIDVPKAFHVWLHMVTIPPANPTLEVMDLSSLAHQGYEDMAFAVRIGMQLLRNDAVSPRDFNLRIDDLYSQYNDGLARVRSLPPEFQDIDTDMYKVSSPEEMLTVRGELGRLAMKPTVAVTTRIIRQDTIAEPRDEDIAA
jgi:hypothetical protein